MNNRMKQELDNYITGHYGEDQFRNEEDSKDPLDLDDDLDKLAYDVAEALDDDFVNMFSDEWPENPTGHQFYFMNRWGGGVYRYDPTEDGPECEAITRVLAHHPLYRVGEEAFLLQLGILLDVKARQLFRRPYDSLSSLLRQRVRVEVARDRVGARWAARNQC